MAVDFATVIATSGRRCPHRKFRNVAIALEPLPHRCPLAQIVFGHFYLGEV